MAVKKTNSTKKKATTASAKKPAVKTSASPKTKSAPVKKAVTKKMSALSNEPLEPASAYVHTVIDAVTVMLSQFEENEGIGKQLTGTERRRLIGAGIRNWGFIEKAWDIIRENQNFVPNNFSVEDMNTNCTNLEDFRQLYWLLEKFLAVVNECMLVSADAAFRDALMVYNNLREQSKAKVPGAEVLYMALLRYFRRRRSPNGKEETETQLDRDFMKLVHGKADGKIEIVNEQPVFSGGVHKVVDDVHKSKGSVQVKADEEFDE